MNSSKYRSSRWVRAAVVSGLLGTWAATGMAATWMQMPNTGSPSNCHHDATYDSGNQRLVVCARVGLTNQATMHFLDSNSVWSAGPSPASMDGNDIEVAYDSSRQVTVLYTVSNSVPQVWELSDSTWTQRSFVTTPVACGDGALLQYDPLRQRTVLVGSTNVGSNTVSQTWLWDGTNWSQVAGSPVGAAGGGMVFDEARGEIVLLPMFATNTWTFNGTNWTSKMPTNLPTPGVWVFDLAYDAVNQRVVKYGGEGSSYPTNTWVWNGSNWSELNTAASPPPTIDMAMAWFPPLGGIIMHGGWCTNDAWTIRNAVWLFAIEPVITTQPSSQSVTAGTNVTFSVTASGTVTLAYQWQKDGNNLANATNSVYTIASVQTSDAGDYQCVVSNQVGVTTSQVATLTVISGGTAPEAPTHVSASDGTYTNKVRVTWDTVSGATSYLIYRSLTNSGSSASQVGTNTDTTYDDTSATNWPGILLYYWVKARNAAGTSDFSSSDHGYCAAGTPSKTPVAGDFDGDNKADPTLFQEATGNWSVMLSASGYGTASLDGFGGEGYTPVAGDFDGDRRSDPAVYQDAAGTWLVKLSGSGYTTVSLADFGGSGYSPIQADYDGDGKTDPAVYSAVVADATMAKSAQETTGTWLVKLSGGGYTTVSLTDFGGSGYSPVQADYDGDGKTDPAVYQETTGTWLVKLSGSGYTTVSLTDFGGSGYSPIEADYDGDGKTDPAVYSAVVADATMAKSAQDATGTWQVKLSASDYATVSLSGFGGLGYSLVSGDYDGDGKADPAIYLPSSGTWFIKLSASGYATATANQ